METTLEGMIDVFLTRCGKVFTSAQFEIAFDQATGTGGSSPDIVALDFGCTPREVIVVEITTGSSIAKLAERVRERQTRWFNLLMSALQRNGVVDDTWQVRFLGFVREANVEAARKSFADDIDVWFHPIERAILPYSYWDERMAKGVPRRPA